MVSDESVTMPSSHFFCLLGVGPVFVVVLLIGPLRPVLQNGEEAQVPRVDRIADRLEELRLDQGQAFLGPSPFALCPPPQVQGVHFGYVRWAKTTSRSLLR